MGEGKEKLGCEGGRAGGKEAEWGWGVGVPSITFHPFCHHPVDGLGYNCPGCGSL